ncbi:GTP pyrophosphokinase family protein [Pectinatus frisingensis]|jgi:GTP pyrophosphokinase|uniref:GTP pyrophosphokinase n=1 Tax=Pectinatus frisingensis TaxID=865 RepID=UPI0015F55ED1|nr:GTP pyrophosphokinase family protein [Pectinatus frisingensis]
MTDNIYGKYKPVLKAVLADIAARIEAYNEQEKAKNGEMAYEHLIYRIKSSDSMAEKCCRKGLPETSRSALLDIKDAIGIRIVCRFVDDIYLNVRYIKAMAGCRIVQEKDYIKHVKPNGYRSYHMILEFTEPYEDAAGENPGHFFAEIQIRTIAMDSWASLEHQMKYKHDVKNTDIIERELKRCADELAACDVSMQTIRNLICSEQ